ncbi:hypothetical protein DB354_13410 [Opitutus sp. ER46]|nr:hypothetical protein DB354_13410 [Opitutus sp. ER46]
MIAYVFRPKRTKNGKMGIGRIYRARFRLDGDFTMTDISLETSDKQVAEKKLRELIAEKERERAGLLAPKLQRESAQKPILTHVSDFTADLATIGRTPKYQKDVRARISRLMGECSWKSVSDITSGSFVGWRSQQGRSSPKTLNEYLNSVSAFLNWMVKQGRLPENPLRSVVRVDVRGRQRKRRAFTDDELNRLLNVAPPKVRLLYLAAAFTGLRAGELRQVRWGDLRLDHERPHIAVRASTTKNRKDALLPIHPQLLAELKEVAAGRNPQLNDPVFVQLVHPDERIKIDLKKAGITRIDPLGRKLDFHALRYTFATKLASSGVSQRLAQELLRHSDPRLTANIYTDATQLPTFAAVNALAWQSQDSKDTPSHKPAPEPDTQIDSQSADMSCRGLAGNGEEDVRQIAPIPPTEEALTDKNASRAEGGVSLKLGAGVGFEPTTFRL